MNLPPTSSVDCLFDDCSVDLFFSNKISSLIKYSLMTSGVGISVDFVEFWMKEYQNKIKNE